MNHFDTYLKSQLKKNKIKQVELASATNVDPATVWRWINGKGVPSTVEWNLIAKKIASVRGEYMGVVLCEMATALGLEVE